MQAIAEEVARRENCEAVDTNVSSRLYCRYGQPWSNHQYLPVEKAAMILLLAERALSVIGDGNCLFRVASLLMAGHEENAEFLLRASLELGMHVDYYADLVTTLTEDGQWRIRQSGAVNPISVSAMLMSTLSDHDLGIFQTLNPSGSIVRCAYEQALTNSVRNTAKLSEFVSIAHLSVLATVLGIRISSVYLRKTLSMRDFLTSHSNFESKRYS